MDNTDISSPILDGGEGCVVGGEDEEASAVREKREHLYMYSASGGSNKILHVHSHAGNAEIETNSLTDLHAVQCLPLLSLCSVLSHWRPGGLWNEQQTHNMYYVHTHIC